MDKGLGKVILTIGIAVVISLAVALPLIFVVRGDVPVISVNAEGYVLADGKRIPFGDGFFTIGDMSSEVIANAGFEPALAAAVNAWMLANLDAIIDGRMERIMMVLGLADQISVLDENDPDFLDELLRIVGLVSGANLTTAERGMIQSSLTRLEAFHQDLLDIFDDSMWETQGNITSRFQRSDISEFMGFGGSINMLGILWGPVFFGDNPPPPPDHFVTTNHGAAQIDVTAEMYDGKIVIDIVHPHGSFQLEGTIGIAGGALVIDMDDDVVSTHGAVSNINISFNQEGLSLSFRKDNNNALSRIFWPGLANPSLAAGLPNVRIASEFNVSLVMSNPVMPDIKDGVWTVEPNVTANVRDAVNTSILGPEGNIISQVRGLLEGQPNTVSTPVEVMIAGDVITVKVDGDEFIGIIQGMHSVTGALRVQWNQGYAPPVGLVLDLRYDYDNDRIRVGFRKDVRGADVPVMFPALTAAALGTALTNILLTVDFTAILVN